ncbi:hypothetical protein GGR51DRAFT_561860 [Nemania sp. FL0031]|nr:hypothetical protein GGR51DRAFT_561860 [Nemania sp. FL0031]
MALDDCPSRLEMLSVIVFLVATVLVPLGFEIFYRFYFHPLKNIPGPWLAALNDLYGFYHNVVGAGYSKRLERMHRYHSSPVIRIGPNHVHINRPNSFDEPLSGLQSMAERLERNIGTGEVVNIERMFRTLTAGMVLHLVFPQDV